MVDSLATQVPLPVPLTPPPLQLRTLRPVAATPRHTLGAVTRVTRTAAQTSTISMDQAVTQQTLTVTSPMQRTITMMISGSAAVALTKALRARVAPQLQTPHHT